jgi:hypothetical protein
LFAEDWIILSYSEYDLQKALYTIFKVIISRGQPPIKSKIVIDNAILEQVNMLTYLGHKISNKEEINIFLQTLGILNNIFTANLV